MSFSLILACTIEGGIGFDNKIPWNIREELQLFKKITNDDNKKNAVIMGRKTWESLPIKPLKNRINIIITSKPSIIEFNNEILTFNNLDASINFCNNSNIINQTFIIGGKSLYDECLNNEKLFKRIDNIHLSIIKKKYECDTFINLKKILSNFRNYNLNDIIFNSEFIYIKYLNN
jgi:dihydrofolate reductase